MYTPHTNKELVSWPEPVDKPKPPAPGDLFLDSFGTVGSGIYASGVPTTNPFSEAVTRTTRCSG